MDLNQAEIIAIEAMDKWGLVDKGWDFQFHNKVRSLGTCNLNKRIIQVNRGHAEHDDEAFVTDTILHEIAHALHFLDYEQKGQLDKFRERRWTGRQWKRTVPHHGREWQMWAIKVGATPQASASGSKMHKDVSFKWKLVFLNGDTVEDISGYKRFPSSVNEHTYLKNRKRATLGNVYVVDAKNLESVKRNRNQSLNLYRGNPNRPIGRTVFANVK